MSQLVLPHTIDAGTEIVAVEHQANYVAIRDLINGNLEGGGGVNGNIKANGITAREIYDDFIWGHGPSLYMQQGVFGAPDFKVTPGAGLQLNWANGSAVIADPGGIVSAFSHLIPVFVAAGSTVTIAANASGNPRIDQIILTLSGYGTGGATVSVLQGTATAGATLANRTGAAALPSGSIRLADILMPNGFAGPFVQATHIRDRRQWARGANLVDLDAGGDISMTISAPVAIGTAKRVELSGAPVEVTLSWVVEGATVGGPRGTMHLLYDGAAAVDAGAASSAMYQYSVVLGTASRFTVKYHIPAPVAGSHTFQQAHAEQSNDVILWRRTGAPLVTAVREVLQQVSDNAGA